MKVVLDGCVLKHDGRDRRDAGDGVQDEVEVV
jgi:hypothetical protein